MHQTAYEERTRTGIIGGVATALNFAGRTLVRTYDVASDVATAGARVMGKVATAPLGVLGSLRDTLAGGVKKVFKSEKDEIKRKIAEYEEKIKRLYYEIGKEGSSAEKLESEKVTELIAKVREYEQEIQRLNARISEMAELEAQRKEEAKKEKVKPAKKKVSEEQVNALVKTAIDKALRHADFDSESQKEIFKKIANDLLDDEMEVRILAAAELGKLGIKATADVLLEAVKFDNYYLTAEIINSLTNIGDPRTLTLCKEVAKSPNHKVRISSLRGLYKMGSDEEIASYLIDALSDDHPEVRRTAVTFLGWKDISDSVPGLIQCLQDKEESVRKAAVTALANIKDTSAVLPLMRSLTDDSMDIRQKALDALKAITGEEVNIDITLKGSELRKAVDALKEWWQNERLSKIDELQADLRPSEFTAEPTVEAAPEPAAEAIVEPATEAVALDTTPEPVSLPESPTTEAVTEAYTVETAPEPSVTTEEVSVAEPNLEGGETMAQEAVSEDIHTETITVPEETQEDRYTEDELKRKLKSELLALCREKGIDCDETYTKAEIIEKILKGQQ